MELMFNKEGSKWVAEFKATSDFNLHIERNAKGFLFLKQRTSEGGEYDSTSNASFAPMDSVVDYDFTGLIYPKFIKIVSEVEPTYAAVTTSGEVTEIKSQSKEIEVTSNGTTTVTPDNGFAALNSVNVKVNVPQSGEGGGSSVEYLDVRNIDEDLKWSLINSSYLVKINNGGDIFISPTLFAKNDFDELYVDTIAIAIDFSASVAFNNETTTIKEMISNDNGYPLEVFDSIPRITESEFYTL